MTSHPRESLSLNIINSKGNKALAGMKTKLTNGGASGDLLAKAKLLETALGQVPQKIIIMCDRTGSTEGDMPEVERTVRELRTQVGAVDCPVVLFGDAGTPITVWHESMGPIAHITTEGNGNRHEGGIQALFNYFEQEKIDLNKRNPQSRPIEVYMITDEHADGNLEGFEIDFTMKNDFRGSVTGDDLYKMMLLLKNANVKLHVYTPDNNYVDYMLDPIVYLGQIWQTLANMTGGDWHQLGSMPEAVVQIQAQTLELLNRAQTRILQLTGGNGDRDNRSVISM